MTKRILSCFLLTLILNCPLFISFAIADDTSSWPDSISKSTGFHDLGAAIKSEPGFPSDGTDVEKARYVFGRLPNIAKKYDLKMGNGHPWSNLVVGITRIGNDPENADPLKRYPHWGNCGDWSYAFSEILTGANVPARVAFGDSTSDQGYSNAFNGTDTMVIVEEKASDGRVSRRVFDPFRAGYHSGTNQPTEESIKDWEDIPLSDQDKWLDEQTMSWQKMVGKKYVKDAGNQQKLPHTERLLVNGEAIHIAAKPVPPKPTPVITNSPSSNPNVSGTSFVAGTNEASPILSDDKPSNSTTVTPPNTEAKTADLVVNVIDENRKPINGAFLTLSGETNESTRSNNGYSVFHNLPVGLFTLDVTADGYSKSHLTALAQNGAPAVTVMLKKIKDLAKNINFAVLIVDKEGKRVENVTIQFFGPMKATITTPSGTAIFKGFIEGTYGVKVSAKNYVTLTEPITISPDMGGEVAGMTGVTMLLEKGKSAKSTFDPPPLPKFDPCSVWIPPEKGDKRCPYH